MNVKCKIHTDRDALAFDLSKEGKEGLCEHCWNKKLATIETFVPEKNQKIYK